MPERLQGDAFRAAATRVFATVRIVLIVFALSCPVIGWLIGGIWGLVIATILGWGLSFILAFGITFFYAMSQDGA